MEESYAYYLTEHGNYHKISPLISEIALGGVTVSTSRPQAESAGSEPENTEISYSDVLAMLLDEDVYAALCKWESYYNPWFKHSVPFAKVVADQILSQDFIQKCLAAWINLNDSMSFIPDPADQGTMYMHEDVRSILKGQ